MQKFCSFPLFRTMNMQYSTQSWKQFQINLQRVPLKRNIQNGLKISNKRAIRPPPLASLGTWRPTQDFSNSFVKSLCKRFSRSTSKSKYFSISSYYLTNFAPIFLYFTDTFSKKACLTTNCAISLPLP